MTYFAKSFITDVWLSSKWDKVFKNEQVKFVEDSL